MVVSGTVYALMEFGVVIGSEQLSLLIIGGTGALTAIGRLIIFLILLKIGWKVSTCVRTAPVKSFLYQTTHSKFILKNPYVPHMSICG